MLIDLLQQFFIMLSFTHPGNKNMLCLLIARELLKSQFFIFLFNKDI